MIRSRLQRGLFGLFIAGCVADVTTIMLPSWGVGRMWAGRQGVRCSGS